MEFPYDKYGIQINFNMLYGIFTIPIKEIWTQG